MGSAGVCKGDLRSIGVVVPFPYAPISSLAAQGFRALANRRCAHDLSNLFYTVAGSVAGDFEDYLRLWIKCANFIHIVSDRFLRGGCLPPRDLPRSVDHHRENWSLTSAVFFGPPTCGRLRAIFVIGFGDFGPCRIFSAAANQD